MAQAEPPAGPLGRRAPHKAQKGPTFSAFRSTLGKPERTTEECADRRADRCDRWPVHQPENQGAQRTGQGRPEPFASSQPALIKCAL